MSNQLEEPDEKDRIELPRSPDREHLTRTGSGSRPPHPSMTGSRPRRGSSRSSRRITSGCSPSSAEGENEPRADRTNDVEVIGEPAAGVASERSLSDGQSWEVSSRSVVPESPYRDPAERVGDYNEFVVRRSDEELADGARRCMECGVPFCHNGCPLGNLIPDWERPRLPRTLAGCDPSAPLDQQLPRFTGRLCPAPAKPPACSRSAKAKR